MSVTRLREIKREIRVLGLASWSNPDTGTHETVGVIFRGKHWLDGVLKTSSGGPSITAEVAETIRRSNHHPQIRVILLHREPLNDGAEIDPHRLSRETGKPVIALGFQDPPQNNQRLTSPITVGIDEKTAKRILKITSRTGSYPEALRVAELLAESFNPN
ncbi:DUF99 family protein [Candidatus Bathyarchaeota archaeon]|nr:DUF99 family protein [Candidatus Bathyarchaeota archaeon]MBL7079165.1 DUF99 family protein [Candidatus Bathyarchaeota archaeon]